MSSKSSLNSSESLPLVQKSFPDDDSPATGSYIRRKSSAAKLAIERMVRTRERLWSTTVSALIASIPALLVGFTIGYPSPALLDLGDLPEDFRFNTLLSDLFGVSFFVAVHFSEFAADYCNFLSLGFCSSGSTLWRSDRRLGCRPLGQEGSPPAVWGPLPHWLSVVGLRPLHKQSSGLQGCYSDG